MRMMDDARDMMLPVWEEQVIATEILGVMLAAHGQVWVKVFVLDPL